MALFLNSTIKYLNEKGPSYKLEPRKQTDPLTRGIEKNTKTSPNQ